MLAVQTTLPRGILVLEKMKISLILLVFISFLSVSCAWDQSDIEIFDLVEEINQNFYDVLGVLQVSADQ